MRLRGARGLVRSAARVGSVTDRQSLQCCADAVASHTLPVPSGIRWFRGSLARLAGPGSSGAHSWTRGVSTSQRAFQHDGHGDSRRGRDEASCWRCGAGRGDGGEPEGPDTSAGTPSAPSFFCGRCNAVQPLHTEHDYFKLMGIDEPCYDIDLAALEKAFKAAQFQLHPDRFGGASSAEQEVSADLSSALNEAYHVLKCPLLRAKHLLRLLQPDVDHDHDEEATTRDPELLMWAMELREAVEDASADELEKMREDTQARVDERVAAVSAAFKAGDLAQVQTEVVRLRYLKRAMHSIVDKL
ncbi:unnamed protein product [Pedinophyceae sp. YPF-701]|nr:unnamed protein product [Pedinophyceae sp. YPF-701]